MANAKLAVSITADDGTKKGVDSAGKRFSDLKKKAGAVGREGNGLQQFSRHFHTMERATSKGFGRSSVTSAVNDRFSAMKAASESFGEAKAAGGGGIGSLLSLATSGLGLFAGAAVAAGAAAFAFVDSWSRDAAALDRLSQATGMAARDIDALAAANRTVGITREQTEASLENLGKRLNDAQYGRNQEVLGMNNQFHLGIKRDGNGTPDVNAFLIALAGTIASYKNPYTQEEIANRYGVGALLPELRKGSAQFAADLANARENATGRDGNDTALGARNLSKKVQLEERGEKVVNATGAKGAKGEEAVLDAGLAGAEGLKNVVANPGKFIRQAAGAVGHALDEGAHVVEEGFGKVSKSLDSVVGIIARTAKEEGLNVRQVLTMTRIESHFDPNAHAKGSSASGVLQFTRGTARQYGLTDPTDVAASIRAYARKERHELPILQRKMGHQATPWEVYLLHQQGLGGAIQTLTGDQNRNAAEVLGQKQVLNNGGNADMTLANFEQLWGRRYSSSEKANTKQGVDKIADAAVSGPSKVEVAIKFAGAPQGTVTTVSGAPNVNVKVERAMTGQ